MSNTLIILQAVAMVSGEPLSFNSVYVPMPSDACVVAAKAMSTSYDTGTNREFAPSNVRAMCFDGSSVVSNVTLDADSEHSTVGMKPVLSLSVRLAYFHQLGMELSRTIEFDTQELCLEALAGIKYRTVDAPNPRLKGDVLVASCDDAIDNRLGSKSYTAENLSNGVSANIKKYNLQFKTKTNNGWAE